MTKGKVKWFNDPKGYGFILQDNGPDIFVHYTQIEGRGFKTLDEGEVVHFTLCEGPSGFFAEQVVRANTYTSECENDIFTLEECDGPLVQDSAVSW